MNKAELHFIDGVDDRKHWRGPGWNLDAFRNVVSLIAHVQPGDDVAAAEQATSAIERRVTLVGIGSGEVASTERRIAGAFDSWLPPLGGSSL